MQTSNGGEAVAVNDGDRSAAAVRAPDGDWYAGGDGNLYRHTDGGWQRYGDERTAVPREAEVVRDAPAGGYGGEAPGLGRPVDDAGYVPSRPVGPSTYEPSHYVPSTSPYLSGLNQQYAARQRAAQLDQRHSNWGRGFGNFGGGRYGGFSRGGRR